MEGGRFKVEVERISCRGRAGCGVVVCGAEEERREEDSGEGGEKAWIKPREMR